MYGGCLCVRCLGWPNSYSWASRLSGISRACSPGPAPCVDSRRLTPPSSTGFVGASRPLPGGPSEGGSHRGPLIVQSILAAGFRGARRSVVSRRKLLHPASRWPLSVRCIRVGLRQIRRHPRSIGTRLSRSWNQFCQELDPEDRFLSPFLRELPLERQPRRSWHCLVSESSITDTSGAKPPERAGLASALSTGCLEETKPHLASASAPAPRERIVHYIIPTDSRGR